MSLAPFSYPDGSVSLDACIQQIDLLICVQNDLQVRAAELLNGIQGGVISVWAVDAASLPPSWAVIVDGDSVCFVIAGTTNLNQMFFQAAGATGDVYHNDPTINVGRFWSNAYSVLSASFRASIPTGTRTVRISGHSYGGAVAQLFAFDLAKTPGSVQRIELLTFGQPQPLTQGFTGTLPGVYHRVAHELDPVAFLPPYGFDVESLNPFNQRYWSGEPMRWWRYGTGAQLSDAGTVTPDARVSGGSLDFLARLYATFDTRHVLESYARLIGEAYLARGGNPASDVWARAAIELAAMPNPQIPAGPFPPQQWVDYASANRVYFGPGAAIINAASVGLLQSVALAASSVLPPREQQGFFQGGSQVALQWKFTLIINNSRYGTSENFVWAPGGERSLNEAFVKAQDLAFQRAFLLGNVNTTNTNAAKSLGMPVIEFVRISDPLNLRVSKLFPLGWEGRGLNDYVGFNAAAQANSADHFSTALSIVLGGNSGGPPARRATANHLIRGQPDAVVQRGVFIGNGVTLMGRTFGRRLADWLNYLVLPANNFGFMGLNPATPVRQCGNFTINVNNRWQVACIGHGYGLNDKVQITRSGVSGLNAVWRIAPISADAFELADGPSTTLPRPTSSKARLVQLASGVKQLAFYGFEPPADPFPVTFAPRISTKKLAREFLPVSFRRKRRVRA